MLTATGTAIGSCGGEGAAIAGSAIGAGISSYASDCIEEHYSKFKKKGYGTSINVFGEPGSYIYIKRIYIPQ